jgi:hypothetical protein
LKRDENTKSVAALIASEIASKAVHEKHPVFPTGSDTFSTQKSVAASIISETTSKAGSEKIPVSPTGSDVSSRRSPLRTGVSPKHAVGGHAVARWGGSEEHVDSKAVSPAVCVPPRLVLSRNCVKQPKVSPVPQSVTLEELSGSFALGCIVPPDLLATMDWRGKHILKGSSVYSDAKFVISRAQQLIKSDLANPQTKLWLPGPIARGFVSQIL